MNFGKKQLLEQCFMEETKALPDDYRGAMQVYNKIYEKTKNRQEIYPKGENYHMLLEERSVIDEKKGDFIQSSKSFFALLLVFEAFTKRESLATLQVAKHHMIEFKSYFGDPALSMDTSNPNKMLYDAVRILSLRIVTDLNIALIQLHQEMGDQATKDQIKRQIVSQLICLCHAQMLIKDDKDAHSLANKEYITQTVQRFNDVIKTHELERDFMTTHNYLQNCKTFSQNIPVDTSQFSTAQDITLNVSEDVGRRIFENNQRLECMLEVKSNDDKKIANFNQSLTKFKKNFTKEI